MPEIKITREHSKYDVGGFYPGLEPMLHHENGEPVPRHYLVAPAVTKLQAILAKLKITSAFVGGDAQVYTTTALVKWATANRFAELLIEAGFTDVHLRETRTSWATHTYN